MLCLASAELPSKEELISMIDRKYEIEKRDKKCETLSELGRVFMKSRQLGVSFETLYGSVDKGTFPDDMKVKERQMIIQAFNYPRYEIESDQFKVSEKFHLQAFLECREKGLSENWNLK